MYTWPERRFCDASSRCSVFSGKKIGPEQNVKNHGPQACALNFWVTVLKKKNLENMVDPAPLTGMRLDALFCCTFVVVSLSPKSHLGRPRNRRMVGRRPRVFYVVGVGTRPREDGALIPHHSDLR